MASERPLEFWFRAGHVEKYSMSSRGYWLVGYSRLSEHGNLYPWSTKREAQTESKRRGHKAVFFETYDEAREAYEGNNAKL